MCSHTLNTIINFGAVKLEYPSFLEVIRHTLNHIHTHADQQSYMSGLLKQPIVACKCVWKICRQYFGCFFSLNESILRINIVLQNYVYTFYRWIIYINKVIQHETKHLLVLIKMQKNSQVTNILSRESIRKLLASLLANLRFY